MRALDYGARANYQTLLGSNNFPCTRYMHPPISKQVWPNTVHRHAAYAHL
jgi:hypothetical protein